MCFYYCILDFCVYLTLCSVPLFSYNCVKHKVLPLSKATPYSLPHIKQRKFFAGSQASAKGDNLLLLLLPLPTTYPSHLPRDAFVRGEREGRPVLTNLFEAFLGKVRGRDGGKKEKRRRGTHFRRLNCFSLLALL